MLVFIHIRLSFWGKHPLSWVLDITNRKEKSLGWQHSSSTPDEGAGTKRSCLRGPLINIALGLQQWSVCLEKHETLTLSPVSPKQQSMWLIQWPGLAIFFLFRIVYRILIIWYMTMFSEVTLKFCIQIFPCSQSTYLLIWSTLKYVCKMSPQSISIWKMGELSSVSELHSQNQNYIHKIKSLKGTWRSSSLVVFHFRTHSWVITGKANQGFVKEKISIIIDK